MSAARHQFELPDPDREFLERRHLPWETLIEATCQWVILHEYPVPSGYNHVAVSAALQLPASYPDTQIDMVYFHPHLELASGRAIGGLSTATLDGKSWQRWSRHRTGANPWRRGYDSIETHLLLVDEWLDRECRRAA